MLRTAFVDRFKLLLHACKRVLVILGYCSEQLSQQSAPRLARGKMNINPARIIILPGVRRVNLGLNVLILFLSLCLVLLEISINVPSAQYSGLVAIFPHLSRFEWHKHCIYMYVQVTFRTLLCGTRRRAHRRPMLFKNSAISASLGIPFMPGPPCVYVHLCVCVYVCMYVMISV
jgi:hypothetical protein